MPAVLVKPLVRTLTAWVAAVGVLALPIMPAEHVHATEAEDGAQSEIIHRHFESHHHDGPAKAGHDEGHDEDVDHAADAARWLTAVFTGPTPPTQVHPNTTAVVAHDPAATPRQASQWILRLVDISVHDPPWTRSHGLRGPPLPSV